jgi:hypothetical protein
MRGEAVSGRTIAIFSADASLSQAQLFARFR